MGFWATLKLLLTSVPALMKLLTELAGWLKHTFGDDPIKQIEEQTEAIRKLLEAKSPNEKAAAAATLSALIRRL